ncbi:MAG: hypothetical protein MRY49_02545 [Candidatus Pacebacteria bacterium]|nr:hypothetical protein [Candidatus Paceibacterota bacterium]
MIIFESNGEIPKDVMATAVVSAMKKKYPNEDIVVTTLAPEIWLHNPNVYRVYNLHSIQYFYDDYIKDKNPTIFKYDPYRETDFITQKKHVIDIWCNSCKVDRNNQMPEIHFTEMEKEIAQNFIDLHAKGKKTCLIQPEGAVNIMPYPTPFSRNMHKKTVEEVVSHLKKEGYIIFVLTGNEQNDIQDTIPVKLPGFRETLATMMFVDKRLLIDSVAHHVATALNLPSVITWNTLTPKVQGYEMHNNIYPIADTDLITLEDNFVNEFRLTGILPEQKPTYSKEIHRTEEIIEALDL